MGRIAYGLGLAGVSWAVALIAELEPRTVSVYRGSPSPCVVALLHHAGPLLFFALPIVLAFAVFAPKSPRRRLIAALVGAPLAFGAALIVQLSLSTYGDTADGFSDFTSFAGMAFLWIIAAVVVGALVMLPMAPILALARPGESDDHDTRARARVGVALVIPATIQLIFLLWILLEQPFYGIPVAPAAAAFVFGVVEIVRSRRALASLHEWLSTVRAGAVHGLRVRNEQLGDESLYIPDVISIRYCDGSQQVLEAYADGLDAGPYRMRRSMVPLGRVPRE